MGIDENFWNDLKQGNDFIADVSNCSENESQEPIKHYQVYLNADWIADCSTYEEAETIANARASDGVIEIHRN